jgi:hypothetical protein
MGNIRDLLDFKGATQLSPAVRLTVGNIKYADPGNLAEPK